MIKAMLLAAGLGTRLRPQTYKTPKPLLKVNGTPLIFYNLALLKKYGITDVVINLHHLGDQIIDLLGNGNQFGFNFSYSYEPKILGTGGGLKKASKFFGKKSFLVLNADIIIDINLKKLISYHEQQNPFATLVVKESPYAQKFGILYVDKKNRIQSILKEPPKGLDFRQTFFTGVHVLSPKALSGLKSGQKSCIIRDSYMPLIDQKKLISAYSHTGYWNDLGTYSRLTQTSSKLERKQIKLSFYKQLETFKKQLANRQVY